MARTAKKAGTRKAGRPSAYTPEVATRICERIIGGESLRAVCRRADMPAVGTVRRWIAEDREGFRDQYARACEARAEYWADEIVEIADDTKEDAHSRRVRVDARKWLASKLLPKKYGDRLDLTNGGERIEPAEQVAARLLAGLPGGRRDLGGGVQQAVRPAGRPDRR